MTTRGPLHIHHATIRDFRGIDVLELDLPAGDAPGEGGALVLGGDNGFGKTTVLEALALALGRGDLLPPDSATLAEQVRFGCRDFSIELEVACDGRDLRLKCNRAVLEQPEVLVANTYIGDSPAQAAVRATRNPSNVQARPNGPFWHKVGELAPRVVYLSARRDPDGLHASDVDNAPLSGESRRIAALKKTLISLYNRKQTRRPPAPDDRSDRFERLQRFVRRFLGEDATVDVMFIDDSDRNGQEVVLRRGELPEGVATLADARASALERDDVPVVLAPIGASGGVGGRGRWNGSWHARQRSRRLPAPVAEAFGAVRDPWQNGAVANH